METRSLKLIALFRRSLDNAIELRKVHGRLHNHLAGKNDADVAAHGDQKDLPVFFHLRFCN